MFRLGGLLLLLVASGLLVVACGDEEPTPAPEPPTEPPTEPAMDPEVRLPPSIDFEVLDPPAYLALMKEHAGMLLTVGAAPEGWITEAHVEALLAHVDDASPAAVTVALVSSYIPFDETSTVGREALFLIQGFREGFFPPAICSVGYFDPDPEGTKRWWAERDEER